MASSQYNRSALDAWTGVIACSKFLYDVGGPLVPAFSIQLMGSPDAQLMKIAFFAGTFAPCTLAIIDHWTISCIAALDASHFIVCVLRPRARGVSNWPPANQVSGVPVLTVAPDCCDLAPS